MTSPLLFPWSAADVATALSETHNMNGTAVMSWHPTRLLEPGFSGKETGKHKGKEIYGSHGTDVSITRQISLKPLRLMKEG